jgi:hypothetical protein
VQNGKKSTPIVAKLAKSFGKSRFHSDAAETLGEFRYASTVPACPG